MTRKVSGRPSTGATDPRRASTSAHQPTSHPGTAARARQTRHSSIELVTLRPRKPSTQRIEEGGPVRSLKGQTNGGAASLVSSPPLGRVNRRKPVIFRDAAEPLQSQTQARFVTTSYSPVRPLLLLEFSSAIFWNLPRLAVRVRRIRHKQPLRQESRTSRRELASVTASSPQRPGLYKSPRSRLRALDGYRYSHRQHSGQGWNPGLRPLRPVKHVTMTAGMQPAVSTIFGGRFCLLGSKSLVIHDSSWYFPPLPRAIGVAPEQIPIPTASPQL